MILVLAIGLGLIVIRLEGILIGVTANTPDEQTFALVSNRQLQDILGESAKFLTELDEHNKQTGTYSSVEEFIAKIKGTETNRELALRYVTPREIKEKLRPFPFGLSFLFGGTFFWLITEIAVGTLFENFY